MALLCSRNCYKWQARTCEPSTAYPERSPRRQQRRMTEANGDMPCLVRKAHTMKCSTQPEAVEHGRTGTRIGL